MLKGKPILIKRLIKRLIVNKTKIVPATYPNKAAVTCFSKRDYANKRIHL